MIKSPETDMKDLTMTVRLKSGERFIRRDVPEKPFGDNEQFVSFWANDTTIMIVPMSEVVYVTLNFA